MRGNDTTAEAAIRCGCQAYFGYPITPQNEIGEYMARELTKRGGVFLQAESEISAINMVIGASVVGARIMTSSSSCGMSLKQEGISYLAGLELPAVIISVNRGGPGLGNISPSQGDYNQTVKGGGHGDYKNIVLAPSSVQEIADLTVEAFNLADKYRNPVIVLFDGMLGQMMEPVVFEKKGKKHLYPKDWVLGGAKGRKSRFIRSLILDTGEMEEHNWKLYRKYQRIKKQEQKYERYNLDDAEIAIVAFGSSARIAKAAVKRAKEKGIKVGLIRPITLWPFPEDIIRETAEKISEFIVFEMNTGQMLEDVKLALEGKGNITFYGRPGGIIPTPLEFFKIISKVEKNSKIKNGKNIL